VKNVASYLTPGEPFCFTYGDTDIDIDIDIDGLVAFHKVHGKRATVTAVIPPGRYGALSIERDRVVRFIEKPAGDNAFINGGFFVLDPLVADLIDDGVLSNVFGDDRPGSYDGAIGDGNSRQYRRIASDRYKTSNTNGSGDGSARHYVDAAPKYRLVIDAGVGIDNAERTDFRFLADCGHWQNLGTLANNRSNTDMCRRVDQRYRR
jgi:hypothetical protein